MIKWYAYKKHFIKKNNDIISIKDTYLKLNKNYSSDLKDDQKIKIFIGNTFKLINQDGLYYIVNLPIPAILTSKVSLTPAILTSNVIQIPSILTKNVSPTPSILTKNVSPIPSISVNETSCLPIAKASIIPENKEEKKFYISIGWRCDSAIRRTKLYHLKHPEYKTCPFDLMIYNLNGIIKCFETNFQYFCDPQYLEYNGKGYIKNTFYQFMFNHETPGHADLHLRERWPGNNKYHFTENNFENFINRYNRRILNLKNYIEENDHIIFILQIVNVNQKNQLLLKLKNILKQKYPLKNFSFYLFPEPNIDFFKTHMSISGIDNETINLLL